MTLVRWTDPFREFAQLQDRFNRVFSDGDAGLLTSGTWGPPVDIYQNGDLEVVRFSHSVKRAGREITLQPREFRLLEYLMRHAGQVVTRTMLLENVWDYHFDPQTNVIDVHVSRLRGKIEKGFDSPILHTVRGAGYMLKAA